MGGSSFTNEQPRLADIRIQSSAYGSTIPWLLTGRGRVAGNLLYYGAFKAIKHSETQSGGKGGGGSQTTVSYTYQAAVIIGLARGPLVGSGAMWRGKSQFGSFASGGLSLQLGNLGQAVWSWLATNDSSKALGYSGMAYAYAQAYDLDSSASLPNHNFEIDAGGLGTVPGVAGTVFDGDPRLAVERLLTDTRSGGGWPADRLLGLDRYQAYCRAAGIWLSPVLTEQRSALDWLKQLLMLTNTKAANTGSALELVPLGDEDLSAHGATFTAEVTPDFDLTLDHFVPDKGEPPVRIRRHVGLGTDAEIASSDDVGYNVITIKIENRASGYAEQPISRDDLASIEQFGRREKEAIAAPEIKDAAIAAQVAQQLLQDELAKRNRYEFNLSWRFCLLKPLRLLTLTVPSLGLDRLPVRILEVEELDDRRISIVAEDAPIGTATAPRYGAQAGSGYAPDYNASPGSALAPLIFELPGALTTTGLELAIATASTNPLWGGCQVWVSFDGINYRQLTELRTNSRYGVTGTDGGTSLALTTNAGQQLLSGSAADASNLATLLYVAPASGVDGEFLAYETASLTGPSAYTLSGLVRGAYNTKNLAHANASPWARVDDAIARSGPLDPALIGKTVYVKLTSFNVFGAGQQSLADVSATTYTITGKHAVGRASATLSIKLNVGDFAGSVNYSEAYIHGRDASGAAVDLPGSILVNGVATPVPNGPLNSNFGPVSGYVMWDLAGSTFSVLGGSTRPYVLARRFQNQWQYDDNNGGSWTVFTPASTHRVIGTLTSGAPDTGAPGSPPGLIAASMWAVAETPDGIAAAVDAVALSSALVFIYQRSASGAPALPSATVTYTFAMATLVGLDGGWSPTPPAGTDPLYVSVATASSSGPSDTIASGEWASVALLAASGAPGADGSDGADGADGADGVNGANQATVYLFQRTGSASAPALPSASVTYTFGTGVATGVDNGWSQTLPTSGGAFRWMTTASALSTGATDTIASSEWAAAALLAQDGADGSDGTDGVNHATVYLFQRTGSAPAPAVPSAAVTFTFSTGVAAGVDNGWTQTLPTSGGAFRWATTATALSTGATDSIATGEWSSPALLAQDGANGNDGSDGIDGSDGLNAATVYLFQRTGSASAPALPSASVTYTFSSGVAAGVDNGWTQTLPTSGGAFRWVTTASALSTGNSDVIASGEWAAAALLAEDGAPGSDGADGSDGTDGQDAIAMTLSASSATLPADSTGLVSDFSLATTTAKVMRGAADDTANWTFSRT
ncbi:MAG: hypothetical protein EOP35_08740, partial [Rubrivivax sp.]